MSGKDADVTLGGPGDDVDRLAGPHLTVGSDDLDAKGCAIHQDSFCIRSQLAMTSSMSPTLKNACSAM